MLNPKIPKATSWSNLPVLAAVASSTISPTKASRAPAKWVSPLTGSRSLFVVLLAFRTTTSPRVRLLGPTVRVPYSHYEDRQGESYQTSWTINPLLLEGSGYSDYKGYEDEVQALEKISK
jgi:hypothetical protein